MSDAEVMRFTGFREPQAEEEIEQKLNEWINTANDELGVLCATDKTTKAFIGWFMLRITTTKYPELGFMLAKNKWGQGYATEVAKGILDYAFKKLPYSIIIASVDKQNIASTNVLKKIGMYPSLELKTEDQESLIYFEIRK